MPIEGRAKRLYRKDITAGIAAALGIAAPKVPRGSTVGTEFLDAVVSKLGGDPATLGTTYRKIEFALNASGEVYDGSHDSSEHLGRMGGGTVTNGGYRKLLRGVTGEPQCFILNIADHPVSEQYADVPGESYGFDDDVSGRVPFLEAGAGSRVVFYRTSKATEEPKRAFIAHAVIGGVGPSEDEGYRALLSDYQEFDEPVPVNDVSIANWNNQHGIAEIDYPTLAAIVEAGTKLPVPATQTDVVETQSSPAPPISAPVPEDVTDESRANRLLAEVVSVDAPVDLSSAVPLPDVLPVLSGKPAPEALVSLPEKSGDEGQDGAGGRGKRRGRARRLLDKYAEQRAVHVARVYLSEQGWRLHRDCQKLGIGYDLDYRKAKATLHVEVKGIQSPLLAFNLTALEWVRVLEDPDFVVIAVTGVLDPETTKIHLVTRDRLAAATRRPVQYRLELE